MQDEFEMVYIINDEHNRIKIGKSTFTKNQFAGRFSGLQCGNADVLTICGIFMSEVLSSAQLERKLHGRLRHKRIRGEWYYCNIWDIYDAVVDISAQLHIEIDGYKSTEKKKEAVFNNDFDNYALYITAKDGELMWY